MSGVSKLLGYGFKKGIFICIITAMCLLGADVASYAAETPGARGDAGAEPQEQLITINMVNADIRDILSAIAISMDANIIYLEGPSRVSFKAENLSPLKALELLIQSIGSQNGQISYIKNGDLIIVGSQEKLQKDFFNQLALTRFKLSYISPETLSQQLDKLEVPVRKLVLDEGGKFIWVQGTPQSLSKVASVIAALDRAENFDDGGSLKSGIELTQFKLAYITADRLEKLIQQLDIDARIIRVDTNPGLLWISGTQQQLADIRQLISKVDIAESAGKALTMASCKMKYLTYDRLVSITGQLDLPVQIIRVGLSQKSIWLQGDQKEINDILSLIAKLDISDNGDEFQFFVYTLRNISAEDAAAKLAFINLQDVTAMTLNYPQLSHELLIRCPFDMIATVSRIVSNLDIHGQRIKAPIDYGDSLSQLVKRKELLSKLTDVPSERIIISENVSRNGGQTYYVMWIEETPDTIKRMREMVDLIDKP